MSNKFPVVLLAALAVSILSVHTARTQSLRVVTQIPPADIVNAGSIYDPMADKVKDLPFSTFSVSFINTTSPPQAVRAVMHIETYATLDEDHERMLVATADSKMPFTVPSEGRIFTSRDAQGVDDMQFRTVKNDAAVDRIKDKIWNPASGGRVPSGTYEVAITITVIQIGTRAATEVIPVAIAPVVVSNPTVATLLVPSENSYKYSTSFPQFQWISDTRGIMLTVYEKRSGQESLEDAAQASDPLMQAHIDRKASGNASLFTYPRAGASLPGIEILKGPRPLEPGKTYVVVLEGLRSTIGTTVEPLRTIRSFTIDNPNAQSQARTSQSIFSAPELERIQTLLESRNLQIDAAGIMLNGALITPQQLQTFLDQHKNRKFTVHIDE